MRPVRLVTSLGLVLAATVLWLGRAGSHPRLTMADSSCVSAAADTALDSEEQAAITAINALRAREGLPPVGVSAALTRAARWKATQMAAGAPYAHDDPFRGWPQRLADCGYRDQTFVSENLASAAATGAEAVRMWENSAPHRSNLLHPSARVIGIARARRRMGLVLDRRLRRRAGRGLAERRGGYGMRIGCGSASGHAAHRS